MLNDPRSHGLWEATAPPLPHGPPLKAHIAADVVVVGAGYTGLSAALHLAEAGVRAVVLEAAEVGYGGSGRNVGLVNAGLWMMPDDVAAALGAPYGERLLALLGEAPSRVFALIEKHGIACEAMRTGTLHCAVGRRGLAGLSARMAQWTARGAPVRLLGAAETAAMVGSEKFAGALLDLRAGTIQPLAYARGLARAATAAGAQLFEASTVTDTEPAGSRWCVATATGSVTADWIVVATNAYTCAPWAEISSELVRLPYFNVATAPLPDNVRKTILPGLQGAWDTRLVLTSFRLDAAGRLIVGSFGALKGAAAGIHRAWARRTIERIFPQLEALTFTHEWFGMIGMTDDGLPRLHAFAPRAIGISGYNGRGIAPGTVYGATLADHILGRIDAADLPVPFGAPRPEILRGLKEAFYGAGAGLAHFADKRL